MKSKYDLVAIGDCTVDAFIKLHNASIHCDLNHRNCMLCLSFADKVPYDSLTVVPAVGNASNVAIGTARLGLKSAILTAIGGDHFGQQILEVYRKEKVGTEFVKINQKAQTNYHFVLNFRAERTILIKHHNYQYYPPAKISTPEWIYFSSIAQDTLSFHHELARYLAKNPKIKMGFNPGTFQLKLGKEKLKKIYRSTHVLFVNREETQRILRITNSNIKVLSKGLHKLGPRIVVISDGPKGAYASEGEGAVCYRMPIYPDPKSPVERTGAGDAFSAGFMAALVYKLPVPTALCWAPINSMSVVQKIGAQKGLLTKQQLLKLLKKAPKHYYPRKI